MLNTQQSRVSNTSAWKLAKNFAPSVIWFPTSHPWVQWRLSDFKPSGKPSPHPLHMFLFFKVSLLAPKFFPSTICSLSESFLYPVSNTRTQFYWIYKYIEYIVLLDFILNEGGRYRTLCSAARNTSRLSSHISFCQLFDVHQTSRLFKLWVQLGLHPNISRMIIFFSWVLNCSYRIKEWKGLLFMKFLVTFFSRNERARCNSVLPLLPVALIIPGF